MKETVIGTLIFFLAICVLMFAGYGREIIDRIRGKEETKGQAVLVRVVDDASGKPVEGVMLALQPAGADPAEPPQPSQVRETDAMGEARWAATERRQPNVGIRAAKEGYRLLRLSSLEFLKQAKPHGDWLVLDLRLEPDAAAEPVEAGCGEDEGCK